MNGNLIGELQLPDLLLERGWAPLVTFASVGMALVIFSMAQSAVLLRDWPAVEQLRDQAPNRLRAIKFYARFLRFIQVLGTAYFIGLISLMFLYISPRPSPVLIDIAIYCLLMPTAGITFVYLYYGVRVIILYFRSGRFKVSGWG